MKIYLAPLEGITGYTYRRALYQCFGGFDKYFIPFILPNQKGHLSTREKKDIMPENNEGMYAVPQILTKNAEDFIQTAETLQEYGYNEVNLNLGCPSKTVVTKGRGAGFLDRPDELDKFLDEIFRKCDMKISIKTRLGMDDPEEFEDLLTIYNKLFTQECRKTITKIRHVWKHLGRRWSGPRARFAITEISSQQRTVPDYRTCFRPWTAL